MKKFIFTILIGLTVLGGGLTMVPNTVYADKSDEFELTVGIKNPLGDKTEIKDIIAAILKGVIEIALPLVILMVIYSGFLYVIARGKPEAIEKAHKTLTYTLLGAAILLGAQLIATVLIGTISNIAKDGNVSKTTTTTTGGGTTTGAKTTTGTTTGSTTGSSNTSVPSFIKDLKFNLANETSTTASGTFSFYVTNNFTPVVNTLEILCYDKGISFTLDPTNPAPGISDLKVGTYTTPSFTIKNAGDHACKIQYEFGNTTKFSNITALTVPSKPITPSFILTDPIIKLDKLDNLQVRGEIKSFSPTNIVYELDVNLGLDAAGIACVENRFNGMVVNGNWEDSIKIPGFKMGFTGKLITSPMNFLAGMTYICAIEYDDPKNPVAPGVSGVYMITKSFPLQVGAKNR